MSPLSESELRTLTARLERAVEETPAGFRTGGVLLMALFGTMALISAAKGGYGVAVLVGGFGAGLMALAFAAAKKTGPERAMPVIRAVKEKPEDVRLIRHYVTSSSTGMFSTNWLEVKTDDGRLVVKAKDDWEPVMVFLVRRCPGATVIRNR